jgi:hypothetical protein
VIDGWPQCEARTVDEVREQRDNTQAPPDKKDPGRPVSIFPRKLIFHSRSSIAPSETVIEAGQRKDPSAELQLAGLLDLWFVFV